MIDIFVQVTDAVYPTILYQSDFAISKSRCAEKCVAVSNLF